MNRNAALAAITTRGRPYDVIVIGGGATGAGIALDATTRGLTTLLLERGDFGNGTSSRSTKLIHGGVRYLAQGRFGLVREALYERTLLLRNAPHSVQPRPFIIPCGTLYEQLKYGVGLAVYAGLARGGKLTRSQRVLPTALAEDLPNLDLRGIRCGLRYFDAQFDDARFLLDILATAAAHGATVLNYAEVAGFIKRDGHGIHGVCARDAETGQVFEVCGRLVVNATGQFARQLTAMDEPATAPRLALSQGTHIVVSREFMPGDHALLMPKTGDGRVMFAIPWHEHLLLGTTDVPIAHPADEPVPQNAEIEQILTVCAQYFQVCPTRRDILSVFSGVRPLASSTATTATARVSREHHIDVSASGLVTITGGKWTSFRRMAEETLDIALRHQGIAAGPCRTQHLQFEFLPGHGRERAALDPDSRLGTHLPFTWEDCVHAVRNEMARTVADVLARRTRILFLDARAALALAPAVARMLAAELNRDPSWVTQQLESFAAIARHYLPAE